MLGFIVGVPLALLFVLGLVLAGQRRPPIYWLQSYLVALAVLVFLKLLLGMTCVDGRRPEQPGHLFQMLPYALELLIEIGLIALGIYALKAMLRAGREA